MKPANAGFVVSHLPLSSTQPDTPPTARESQVVCAEQNPQR